MQQCGVFRVGRVNRPLSWPRARAATRHTRVTRVIAPFAIAPSLFPGRGTIMKKQIVVIIALVTLTAASQLMAHCDTLAGPVVADARAALEKKDVTPVLKWVPAANEQEIRDAFAK